MKLYRTINGKLVPSEHCYNINSFQNVMDEYGDNSGKIFYLLDCMYNMSKDENPFAEASEVDKLKIIHSSVCPELNIIENIAFTLALEEAKIFFDTPEQRIYRSFKLLLDKLSAEIGNATPDLSKKSGNMDQIKKAVESYKAISEAYNLSFEEYKKTLVSSVSAGGRKKSYDDELDDEDDDL